MSKHHFTYSFGQSNGDTHTLPGEEELSIVIEGVFFSAYPEASVSGPAGLTMTGLRGKAGDASTSVTFAYSPSTTEVVNISFPVRGKTNEGEPVNFTLGVPEGDSGSGQLTVWGYYTDEE